ncbi:hypothetical protein BLOT_004794 [Blomia tropicalis]|nr:hypothetical protein BLOT_004794 [Blomia tropicalis]
MLNRSINGSNGYFMMALIEIKPKSIKRTTNLTLQFSFRVYKDVLNKNQQPHLLDKIQNLQQDNPVDVDNLNENTRCKNTNLLDLSTVFFTKHQLNDVKEMKLSFMSNNKQSFLTKKNLIYSMYVNSQSGLASLS